MSAFGRKIKRERGRVIIREIHRQVEKKRSSGEIKENKEERG